MKIGQKTLALFISLVFSVAQAKAYACHYYKIKKGDTLDVIARKFGVYTKSIKEANPSLKRSKFLSIGKTLCIPYNPPKPKIPTMSYKVRSGDTLSVLAERFDTSVREIKELNNLRRNFLKIGETLKVPYSKTYLKRLREREERRYKIYVIKYGGTLKDVSDVTGVPLFVLKRLNPDLVGRNLSKGMVVKLGRKRVEHKYYTETKTHRAIHKPQSPSPSNLKALTQNNMQPTTHKIPLPVNGQIKRTDRGINILAGCGKPVKTINSGIVVYSGDDLAAYGNMAIVDGGGIITVYAYNEKLFVKKGQLVKKGQVIGLVGHKPNTSTCELHFELRTKDGTPIDPITYFGK